ncbi:tRNA (adenine-N1)-methyltransferase [Thermovenabulum sp.]|uniref:tRNA (adenine-N1)-methyltransferase n=1 Tax=Thermovenabulum sp. TaxID=3100335 RepID=UPI003C7BC414
MTEGLSNLRLIVDDNGFKKVADISKDKKIGMPNGHLDPEFLRNLTPGSSFEFNGRKFYVFECGIFDYVMYKLKRQTQIVYPKEGYYIMMKLDIGPGKKVGEAGTGSGAFTVCLSKAVGPEGKVYTYEQREEFYNLAMRNYNEGKVFDNVVFYNRSINEGIEERDLDAFFLDVREPWEVLEKVREALKPSGNLGIIVPTVNQVSETMKSLINNNFYIDEAVEIMTRRFKINPERLRPEDMMIGHTGYLIFAKKMI